MSSGSSMANCMGINSMPEQTPVIFLCRRMVLHQVILLYEPRWSRQAVG